MTVDKLTLNISRTWGKSANGTLTPALPRTVKGAVCMHVGTPALCLTSVYTPLLLLVTTPPASGVVGLGSIDLGRGLCSRP